MAESEEDRPHIGTKASRVVVRIAASIGDHSLSVGIAVWQSRYSFGLRRRNVLRGDCGQLTSLPGAILQSKVGCAAFAPHWRAA